MVTRIIIFLSVCVKLVTNAAANVCGHERRNGFIRSGLLSKNEMPVIETKNDFLNMFYEK